MALTMALGALGAFGRTDALRVDAAGGSPRCADVKIKPIDTGGSAGVTSIVVVTAVGPHQSVTQTINAKYGIGMRAFTRCVSGALSELDLAEFVATGGEARTQLNHVRARQFLWSAAAHRWQEARANAPIVAVPNYPQCNCPDKVTAYWGSVQKVTESAAAGR
jgi:hypothetical protein